MQEARIRYDHASQRVMGCEQRKLHLGTIFRRCGTAPAEKEAELRTTDGVLVTDVDGMREGDTLGVSEVEAEMDGDTGEAETEGVALEEAVVDGVSDDVAELDDVMDAVAVLDAVMDAVAVLDAVMDEVAVSLIVGVIVLEKEMETVAVALSVFVAVVVCTA